MFQIHPSTLIIGPRLTPADIAVDRCTYDAVIENREEADAVAFFRDFIVDGGSPIAFIVDGKIDYLAAMVSQHGTRGVWACGHV